MTPVQRITKDGERGKTVAFARNQGEAKQLAARLTAVTDRAYVIDKNGSN